MSQDDPLPPPNFKVVIHPSGLIFETNEKTSLLMSALQAGIRLPSSCRNGTCRICLCRLKDGQIRYLIDWPGLTREEKMEGYLLPCVAVAISDVVIEANDTVCLTTPEAEKKDFSS